MRKSLQNKILISLLAAGNIGVCGFMNAAFADSANDYLNANNNNGQLTINGDDIDKKVAGLFIETVENNSDYSGANVTVNNGNINYNIYGLRPNTISSKENIKIYNNQTNINNATLGEISVYGAYATVINSENVEVFNNSLNLNNVTAETMGDISGAYATTNAHHNHVTIKNSNLNLKDLLGYITGAQNTYDSDASTNNNTVNIINSTIAIADDAVIAGGLSFGNANNNTVNIIGNSKITGNVYGGYSDDKEASGNSITVKYDADISSENADLSQATLYGGINSTGNNVYDNKLIIDGWSGSTQGAYNFNDINFNNINWQNGGTVLSITDNTEENALADTNINVNSIAGGSNIAEGDTMTLITGDNLGVNADKITIDPNFYAGVATEGTGSAAVNADGSVTFTVDTLKAASQTKLVAENRAVAAAFINQGTDLIADSLDVISRDGNYGVKTFAAVHGNRSKYDTRQPQQV